MKRYILQILFLTLIINSTAFSGEWISKIETDKARYEPKNNVNFVLTLNKTSQDLLVKVDYYYLNKKTDYTSVPVNGSTSVSWTWIAPAEDYKGYLVSVSILQGDLVLEQVSIAVDVSSNWSKFPRYGFLSYFGSMRPSTISSNISFLNRFHINGLQFYDWQYKHHKLLPDSPVVSWTEVANRSVSLLTLQRYIDTAHSKNIKSMAYDLVYGAYQNAASDGVPDEWRMYTGTNHQNPDFHDLPDTWASNIYLMDPTNILWQDHLIGEFKNAFTYLPFDGWHADQLGDRGTRYNFQSGVINVPDGFKDILTKAKNSLNCDLVMNSVNQYGQSNISQSPVNFLYTEVWEPNTTYDKLAQIILDNDNRKNGYSASVIAAYIHKAVSGTAGLFNTPAVLFADAVTFAFGGNHIELGEHMLSSEYFPSNNIAMTTDLIDRLTKYYDFMTAYENLLRGGGKIIYEQLNTTAPGINFLPWSRTLSVWNFARSYENKKVFHLLNFTNATTLDWRDNSKIQVEPVERINLPIYYVTNQYINKIWFASPDYHNGVAVEIPFTKNSDTLKFTLPSLKYWDMIVLDSDSTTGINENNLSENIPDGFSLQQNYPNPFNPNTRITYTVGAGSNISLKVFNLLGQEVRIIANGYAEKGVYSVDFSGEGLSSGIYLCELRSGNTRFVKKMNLLK